jgi:hypothetical protein
MVQDFYDNSGNSNVTSYTMTFPQTTAASGNTAFILCGADGSSTVGFPAGWTTDLNVPASTYSRFVLVHKATAADTAATFTAGSASSFACYFFEVKGSHTLDQSSTGSVANTFHVAMPAITPTAGAAVFAFVAGTSNNGNTLSVATFATQIIFPLAGGWVPISYGDSQSGGRFFAGIVSQQPAAAAATTPPVISIQTTTLFTSGGIAYATFSII